jgi:hypothetical protein
MSLRKGSVIIRNCPLPSGFEWVLIIRKFPSACNLS